MGKMGYKLGKVISWWDEMSRAYSLGFVMPEGGIATLAPILQHI